MPSSQSTLALKTHTCDHFSTHSPTKPCASWDKNLSPMPRKTHRGRIQAQGGGLEASESWSQTEPLSKEKGLSLLKRLRNKLSPADQAPRERPFEEAERFIDQTEGGIDAPVRKSFNNRQNRSIRVDIEVWSGTAFVCILLIITIVLWRLL
jgi:hypothetical protein